MTDVSSWYQRAQLSLDDGCTSDTRCAHAKPSGECDSCGTIDGRDTEAVNDYASTCDGGCMELVMHESMIMDPHTQLGYCSQCIPKQPRDIKERLEAVQNGTWKGPLY